MRVRHILPKACALRDLLDSVDRVRETAAADAAAAAAAETRARGRPRAARGGARPQVRVRGVRQPRPDALRDRQLGRRHDLPRVRRRRRAEAHPRGLDVPQVRGRGGPQPPRPRAQPAVLARAQHAHADLDDDEGRRAARPARRPGERRRVPAQDDAGEHGAQPEQHGARRPAHAHGVQGRAEAPGVRAAHAHVRAPRLPRRGRG